jgi:predicted MFS family arabinose efflux permease
MFTFMNLGFGAGAFLDGLAYDTTGSYEASLVVNALLGALAALAVVRVGTRPGETVRRSTEKGDAAASFGQPATGSAD